MDDNEDWQELAECPGYQVQSSNGRITIRSGKSETVAVHLFNGVWSINEAGKDKYLASGSGLMVVTDGHRTRNSTLAAWYNSSSFSIFFLEETFSWTWECSICEKRQAKGSKGYRFSTISEKIEPNSSKRYELSPIKQDDESIPVKVCKDCKANSEHGFSTVFGAPQTRSNFVALLNRLHTQKG